MGCGSTVDYKKLAMASSEGTMVGLTRRSIQ